MIESQFHNCHTNGTNSSLCQTAGHNVREHCVGQLPIMKRDLTISLSHSLYISSFLEGHREQEDGQAAEKPKRFPFFHPNHANPRKPRSKANRLSSFSPTHHYPPPNPSSATLNKSINSGFTVPLFVVGESSFSPIWTHRHIMLQTKYIPAP